MGFVYNNFLLLALLFILSIFLFKPIYTQPPNHDPNDPNAPSLYKEVLQYLKRQNLENSEFMSKKQFSIFLNDMFGEKVPNKSDLPVFHVLTERILSGIKEEKIVIKDMANYLKEDRVFVMLDEIIKEFERDGKLKDPANKSNQNTNSKSEDVKVNLDLGEEEMEKNEL